jgi:hypothetical protein
MKKAIVSFLGVTLLLIGCVHKVSALKFSRNPLKLKNQILKEIPVGTPVDVAERKMKQMRFHCESRKGSFADQISNRGEAGPYQFYNNIEYMVCSQQRSVFCHSGRIYIVGLPYDQNRVVTNVFVQNYNHNYL